jgi:NitT/TauT family transport system permease protein
VILVAGWWLTTALGSMPSYLLPGPGAVAIQLYAGIFQPADMWSYVGVTVTESLLGSVVGTAVALPLAVLIYRVRLVSAAVLPFLGATQAIPAIALAPLLALWIGYGLGPIVALCALMVFFPILVSAVVGFRHIDREILAAAQLDGAGWFALLIYMELPLALHNILAGVRNGFTLSVTGAVVGEMVMGGTGLGTLLTAQRNANDTAGMFATIIVLAAVAATIYSFVSFAERRWSRFGLGSVATTSSSAHHHRKDAP